ncbi:MAG: phosphatase PAP2 family protein [Spirochaetales bacterium]|nr:phosphatase PAP2 family protein [Spirochaetales bacterium]
MKRFILGLDEALSARLRPLAERPAAHGALAAIAHSGDSLVDFPLLALWWYLDAGFAPGGAAFRTLAAALAATLVATGAKYLFRRKRPEGDWGSIYRRTDPHSFPSAHAARTMAIAVAAFSAGVDPAVSGALFLWSLAVGVSRVALGVHHASDVLAGWALGGLVGSAVPAPRFPPA